MKSCPYFLTVLVFAVTLPLVSGHAADDQKTLKALMMKKLENAQKVLEGIALNDPDKVAKHADELIQVSKAAEFKVLKTPEYEMYSNDFRRAAELMRQEAKVKNLDGAALAYVDMTLTCVRCHKHVREVRMAFKD